MRAKDITAGMIVAHEPYRGASLYTSVDLAIVSDPLDISGSYVQVELLQRINPGNIRIHVRKLRPASDTELEGLDEAKARAAEWYEQQQEAEALRAKHNANRTKATEEFETLLALFGIEPRERGRSGASIYGYNNYESLKDARQGMRIELNGKDLKKITDEYFRLAKGDAAAVKRATRRIEKKAAA